MHLSRREVVAIARAKNVIVRNHSKGNIIRAIQRAEGNNDCFGTDKIAYCKQGNCLWREDCLVARYNKHDLWSLI
jgi:hypothetical protein